VSLMYPGDTDDFLLLDADDLDKAVKKMYDNRQSDYDTS
jgi:hypothetical protein